jgi:hypothetical protein
MLPYFFPQAEELGWSFESNDIITRYDSTVEPDPRPMLLLDGRASSTSRCGGLSCLWTVVMRDARKYSFVFFPFLLIIPAYRGLKLKEQRFCGS